MTPSLAARPHATTGFSPRTFRLFLAITAVLWLGGGWTFAGESDIAAATVVLEAGGEGMHGMVAVVNVIHNRSKGDGSRYAAVCLKPKQFSCWNSGEVDALVARARRHPRWSLAVELVLASALGELDDVTGGADHYHATSVNPYWAASMRRTVRIRNHVFYASK